MEQHDEAQGADYPRGRGYGHDYMRGGEVFGGYGYSQRDEYECPRGELKTRKQSSGHDDAPTEDSPHGDPAERFPQDERAGGWEVPHDLDASSNATPTPNESDDTTRASDSAADGTAPVPQIEHTFGDTGGNRIHSRSYYVTQAQLQQRLYTK
jgi:hypothetical protein